jgi:hypothetical protein
MNTNIEDYSIEDLLAILNLQEPDPTPTQVKTQTIKLIANLPSENKKNLTVFLNQARDKIIERMNADEAADEADDGADDQADEEADDQAAAPPPAVKKQQQNWWQNQYPAQTDEVERTKPTDRKQKVDIFDQEGVQNNAFVMNRERLGVLQSHPIPVVQGTINPNLKNIIRRLISVDSQYRSNIIPYANNNMGAPTFNTDFSFDLSDRLNNVISMRLNSIQIPTTWYIFDEAWGNTCFKYKEDLAAEILVKIPSGNYTLHYLNTFFAAYEPPIDLQISVDEVTCKLIFSSNLPVTLSFYNTTLFNSCADNSCAVAQMKINQNLGWSLGYRTNEENTLLTTLSNEPPPASPLVRPYYSIAQAAPNVYGPSYFLLVVDDYNNNRVNNTLVTITNVSNKLDLPSYYNTAVKNANNTYATTCIETPIGQPIPFMVQSSPRQLTQSQLYSANEILYNRTLFSNKTVGPAMADVLALIPLSGIGNLRAKVFYDMTGQVSAIDSQTSQPYVVYGSQLEATDRTYFGPVNIDRMRVRLLDDKGNLVNLNDADWSFSLLVEQLYQY